MGAASLASLKITQSAVEHLEQREQQRALDLLERAIAIDGGNGFAYLYIGYIHLEDGRPDDVVVLPAEALNADDVFIDGVTLEEVRTRASVGDVRRGYEVTQALAGR